MKSPRPPITDRQALWWAWKFVRETTYRWLAEVDRYEQLAAQAHNPPAREALLALSRAYMRCAHDLKDLYFALRLMVQPDEPMPPKLKLVIDNEKGRDSSHLPRPGFNPRKKEA